MSEDEYFMKMAITQAIEGVRKREGGPFGAVIVHQGQVLACTNNRVLLTNDPTAHAEIEAIREACLKLKTHQLNQCVLYASCEPCPMCLGAIYWARPLKLYYHASREDAARAGFDDSLIYDQIGISYEQRLITTKQLQLPGVPSPFEYWHQWGDKSLY